MGLAWPLQSTHQESAVWEQKLLVKLSVPSKRNLKLCESQFLSSCMTKACLPHLIFHKLRSLVHFSKSVREPTLRKHGITMTTNATDDTFSGMFSISENRLMLKTFGHRELVFSGTFYIICTFPYFFPQLLSKLIWSRHMLCTSEVQVCKH